MADEKALFGYFPGPLCRVANDGRVLKANPAAAILHSDAHGWPRVLAWLEQAHTAPDRVPQPNPLLVGHEDARGTIMAAIEWVAVPEPPTSSPPCPDGNEDGDGDGDGDGSAPGGWLLLGRDVTAEHQLRHALSESRQRYKDLVDISSDFAWETGADGRFVFVSPRGAIGYGAEALIGRHPAELTLSEWDDTPSPFVTRRPLERAEVWLRRPDGESACLVVSALALLTGEGHWCGARGVCRDVTREREREAELARARTRTRLINHLIHILRDAGDAASALQRAAETIARALAAAGCRIYGFDAQTRCWIDESDFGVLPATLELSAEAMDSLTRPDDRQVDDYWRLMAPTEHHQIANGAVLVWRPARQGPWHADDHALLRAIADQLGIAQAQIAYQTRLRRLSENDSLTGLLNRRTFLERLETQLIGAASPFSALLYIDLDNFKAVNDLHGHQRGDEVLHMMGTMLMQSVRADDLVGRLGGDEFVVWLSGADRAKALHIADRLLEHSAILRPLSASADKPLSLSIGIALHASDCLREREKPESVAALLERADNAMYTAKRNGRNARALAPDATDIVP